MATTGHDTRLLPGSTLRSLPIALLRARESIMSRFRPMLAAHGLTEQQWRVIRILDEHGSLDASHLARLAFILSPSLTRILAFLEREGMIHSTTDPHDRRRTLLGLTPQGVAKIGAVAPDSARIYRLIEERFGHDRTEALLDLLNELAEQAD
ncbi:homoprotocatechuate degradation operon regulator HpaR [Gluconacetobacter entanii]|uniref:Homoprotocatechuate degradation operon regulator HpaR n=1 Tax=Gluconacetobacter entanii TaxID=108528 RepID=A0A318Q8T2_9PROT|nr:homoprotocatechuate degradation operon regulator HpaR [Gluconacetobacter entanii]PYD62007.1 homoprotocatechuate degradation operon regulator HpaR [Gluconacetobacter entanii]